MAAENQDTGVDNQGTKSDYMWALFEQCTDLNVEYKCSLAIEGNNQNLGVGCKQVETDLEGNSHLRVERAVGKWDPAESNKSGTHVGSAIARIDRLLSRVNRL